MTAELDTAMYKYRVSPSSSLARMGESKDKSLAAKRLLRIYHLIQIVCYLVAIDRMVDIYLLIGK